MSDEFSDIAGIPNALYHRVRRRKAKEARWQNPSDAMIIASTLWREGDKWRQKHPEEASTNLAKAHAALAKWREDHPEGLLANAAKAREAAIQWREESPEEAAAITGRYYAAAAQWRQKNPEKAAANWAKGRKASAQSYAQRYSERLRTIRPFIPTTGISLFELQKLFPEWNRDQLKHFLKKAVQYGDLDRTGKSQRRSRYWLKTTP